MKRHTTTYFLGAIALATFSLQSCSDSRRLGDQAVIQPAPSSKLTTKFRTHPKPLLRSYAAQFKRCDESNYFNGRRMKGMGKCRHADPGLRDLNNLKGFYGFPDGSIMYSAKLSLDVDGGYAPCNTLGGKSDQCPTTYEYKKLSRADRKLPDWRRQWVTSDLVPYIVLPYDSRRPGPPTDADSVEFRKRTKIKIGDVGVVIHEGKVIPVLIADGGPHNKIGEGSLALFDRLGSSRCAKRLPSDQRFCKKVKNWSLGKNVTTIMFPNSRIKGLTPSNTNAKVKEVALRRYRALIK